MNIGDHIQHSLNSADRGELDQALLSACIAVDGTAKKEYPHIRHSGDRYRSFIRDHIDVIEMMVGGLNLEETLFPFRTSKGKFGMTFGEVIYEKFRCSLAHGDEYPDGFGVAVQIAPGHQKFSIDLVGLSMTVPQSTIYALGLVCVLAPVNADQSLGSTAYRYSDPVNVFVVDRWWGQLDCARKIMDLKSRIRVKMDFGNVWPRE